MLKKQIYFNPGKLKQWKFFKKKKYILWIAGHFNYKSIDSIFNLIKNVETIDTEKCIKIAKSLGEHFGLVIISPKWTFAVVDYSRGYPIYWTVKNNKIFLSAQANLLKKKNTNYSQLVAFRMSGYTIGSGTLWKDINGLSAGKYIFFKNSKLLNVKKYFSYLPRESFKLTYTELQNKLKNEINKLLLKTIKIANGREIVVPLSAGLDSRLIASGLKHFNYKNVKCFSYGIKNNYESVASKYIAKKLGFKWKFVKISYSSAKKFYKSKNYIKYITNSADGCATSTIQGLYAIDYLIKNKFISKKNIIINGNSGDFISGGHIHKNIPPIRLSKSSLEKNIDKIMIYHFEKHYSLWENLKNNKNKSIVVKELYAQINETLRKREIPLYGVVEFLEFENRQTKYVVNCQRIYDFYNLDWGLPLWNQSFIKFWEKVPMNFKLNQTLYKDTLKHLNYGNVWTDKFNFKYYLSPRWMELLRFFFKVFFFFIGKEKWHRFEKKFFSYWTENIYGFSSMSYFKFIKSFYTARNYVSIYTLIAEKINIGSNWQNKNSKL